MVVRHPSRITHHSGIEATARNIHLNVHFYSQYSEKTTQNQFARLHEIVLTRYGSDTCQGGPEPLAALGFRASGTTPALPTPMPRW